MAGDSGFVCGTSGYRDVVYKRELSHGLGEEERCKRKECEFSVGKLEDIALLADRTVLLLKSAPLICCREKKADDVQKVDSLFFSN